MTINEFIIIFWCAQAVTEFQIVINFSDDGSTF